VETLDTLIKAMDTAGPVDVKTPIEDAIKKHKEELDTVYGAVELRAPMDGVVSAIFRRKGERIVTGEPLLTVSAPEGTRIVGYLRQPIMTLPSTNDTVIITTRGHPRRKGTGQILSVGTQYDIMRAGLFSQDNARIDTGLTILVELPSGLNVIPGELVDLSIKYVKN
jgi:multidrug resistance efflux pump